MKLFANKLVQFTFGYFILWYLKKDRYYSYQGIKIVIKKGVFHPGFFFSTKMLISLLAKVNLNQKKVLELGAGSGLISFYCASKGANVTATDINLIAIEGLKANNNNLGLYVDVIHSNLFEKIPKQVFDFIVINPPYYPKNPKNDAEKAWYCGEHFEYFEQLFIQLEDYIIVDNSVFMSLSEDCDIHSIRSIASKKGFTFNEFLAKRTLWEKNFIFKIMRK